MCLGQGYEKSPFVEDVVGWGEVMALCMAVAIICAAGSFPL